MKFVITIESTPSGWRASCNPPAHLFSPPAPDNSPTAEIRLKADPYGAHELLMPKCGLVVERRLAEAALLTLIEYIDPLSKGALAHKEDIPA